jgi:predicted nucleotidyltransferase
MTEKGNWKDDLLIRAAAAECEAEPSPERAENEKGKALQDFVEREVEHEKLTKALRELVESEAEPSLEQEVRAQNEKETKALRQFVEREAPETYNIVVSMEKYLLERLTQEVAVTEALFFRKASENWCTQAKEYAKWCKRLGWLLAAALGWALGATWLIWQR